MLRALAAVGAVVGALAALGCEAKSPDVKAPALAPFDAGGVFADTIISFGDVGDQQSCTDVLPACSDSPAPCGPTEVLGPPDGTAYVLPENGRIEVAFRCAQITEKGQTDAGDPTPDFQILATVPDGAGAVVEVSYDGNTYSTLDTLLQTDETFDLSVGTIEMPVVRYVRISDDGSGGIAIDAIAAL